MPKTKRKARVKRTTRNPARKGAASKAKKSAARKSASKAASKRAKKVTRKTAKKTAAGKPSAHLKAAKHKAKASSESKGAPKSPAAKAAWRISPEVSQSILKIDTWKKDELKIEHLKVYRSGFIIVDQMPDLEGYNPDEGVDIFEEFEFDEHQLYDGSKEASIIANELPAEERERLLALSEAELEEEGWTLESVTRFKGPLVVEQL